MEKKKRWLDEKSPVFNQDMSRLEALWVLGVSGMYVLGSAFVALAVVAILFIFCVFPLGLAFMLSIVDNLFLRFIFGFKKTWLSKAVEALTDFADETLGRIQ